MMCFNFLCENNVSWAPGGLHLIWQFNLLIVMHDQTTLMSNT